MRLWQVLAGEEDPAYVPEDDRWWQEYDHGDRATSSPERIEGNERIPRRDPHPIRYRHGERGRGAAGGGGIRREAASPEEARGRGVHPSHRLTPGHANGRQPDHRRTRAAHRPHADHQERTGWRAAGAVWLGHLAPIRPSDASAAAAAADDRGGLQTLPSVPRVQAGRAVRRGAILPGLRRNGGG